VLDSSAMLEHSGESRSIVRMNGNELKADFAPGRRVRWKALHPGNLDFAYDAALVGKEDFDCEPASFPRSLVGVDLYAPETIVGRLSPPSEEGPNGPAEVNGRKQPRVGCSQFGNG
jgi:hypothetical protein